MAPPAVMDARYVPASSSDDDDGSSSSSSIPAAGSGSDSGNGTSFDARGAGTGHTAGHGGVTGCEGASPTPSPSALQSHLPTHALLRTSLLRNPALSGPTPCALHTAVPDARVPCLRDAFSTLTPDATRAQLGHPHNSVHRAVAARRASRVTHHHRRHARYARTATGAVTASASLWSTPARACVLGHSTNTSSSSETSPSSGACDCAHSYHRYQATEATGSIVRRVGVRQWLGRRSCGCAAQAHASAPFARPGRAAGTGAGCHPPPQ